MSNRGQSEAIKEAASLAADLLKNIELSELPLTNMFMKGVRLARLLNDSEMQQTFQYEVSGYPSAPDGVLPEVWKYCAIAKRTYSDKDKEGKVTERANIKSIAELEQQISAASAQLGVATDPNFSISSWPGWQCSRARLLEKFDYRINRHLGEAPSVSLRLRSGKIL